MSENKKKKENKNFISENCVFLQRKRDQRVPFSLHFAFNGVSQFGNGFRQFVELFFHADDEVAGDDDGEAGVGDEGQDFVQVHGDTLFGKKLSGRDGNQIGFFCCNEFAFGAKDAGVDDGLGGGFYRPAFQILLRVVDADEAGFTRLVSEGDGYIGSFHILPPYFKR